MDRLILIFAVLVFGLAIAVLPRCGLSNAHINLAGLTLSVKVSGDIADYHEAVRLEKTGSLDLVRHHLRLGNPEKHRHPFLIIQVQPRSLIDIVRTKLRDRMTLAESNESGETICTG